MRVAFASETSTDVSEAVRAQLTALGHEVIALDGPGLGWADLGLAVGHSVAAGRADRGVAFCGNGVGVTIAANKIGGVRAALCATPQTASAARRFIDANVLTLGLEVVSPDTAVRILQTFLAAEWDGSEAGQIQALGRGGSELPAPGLTGESSCP
jgi:ribose 5-phosphate isomerase B